MKKKRFPRVPLILALIAILTSCALLVWQRLLPQLNQGTLAVTASIKYDARENAQAVAQTTFYLLDADPFLLALEQKNETDPLREKVFRENPKLNNLAGIMNARRREAYSLGPDLVPFMEQSRPLWEPHTVARAQTDHEGHALFNRIEPGAYWLMGRTEDNRGRLAFWNMPVPISRGENKIMLNESNALHAR